MAKDAVSQPKISVVIPAYNSEQYLDECILSARRQILSDIEIILINDGSTDSTLDIMRAHESEDSRIVVIDKENTGYGHTMNTGFHAAHGEYVAILESDDYIELDMYQTLYSIAKRFGDVDVVASDMRRFYGGVDNRKFTYLQKSSFYSFYGRVFNAKEETEALRTNNAMCSGIYKRSFLEERRIRYNETPGASFQDNGFFFQVYTQAESVYWVHNAFYNIRRDNELSSVNDKGKVYCMCDEYDYIRLWAINNAEAIHPNALQLCSKLRYDAYIFTIKRIADEFRMAFLERMRDDFCRLVDNGEVNKEYFSPTEWARLQRTISNPLSAYYIYSYTPEKVQQAREIVLNEKDLAVGMLRKQIKQLEFDKHSLQKEVSSLHRSIERIKASKSFRIGRAITLLPRKVMRGKKHILSTGSETSEKQESSTGEKTEKKNGAAEKLVDAKVSEHLDIRVHSTNELKEQLGTWYEKSTGDVVDFSNPVTYNQKIQWLKVYDSTPKKSMLADKIAVRSWISKKLGPDYLIPILGVWKSFDEIDFAALPDMFVLKANHASGMNVVVKDKNKLDIVACQEKFDEWLRTNYAYSVGWEMHYARIKPLVFAEKYMAADDRGIFDYRFYCFSGKPYAIWVDIGSGTKNHRRDIYDIDWNHIPMRVNYPNLIEPMPKPAQLNKMIEIAELLSEGFAHVRVDLYVIENRIYFGEMTFTPQSGIGKWYPPEYNRIYGDMIVLPEPREFDFENDLSPTDSYIGYEFECKDA